MKKNFQTLFFGVAFSLHKFPEKETMREIVDVHFPNIQKRLMNEALRIFYELREVPGQKNHQHLNLLIGLNYF